MGTQTYTVLDTIHTDTPAWLPILEQARSQMHSRNLPRPAGLPEDGNYGLTWMLRKDGSVRFALQYKMSLGVTKIGVWVQAGTPPKRRKTRGRLETEGRIIAINAGTPLERFVRVAIDSAGLPYPVPMYR